MAVYDFMGTALGLKGVELLECACFFKFARHGKPFLKSKQNTAEFFRITKRAVFKDWRELGDISDDKHQKTAGYHI